LTLRGGQEAAAPSRQGLDSQLPDNGIVVQSNGTTPSSATQRRRRSGPAPADAQRPPSPNSGAEFRIRTASKNHRSASRTRRNATSPRERGGRHPHRGYPTPGDGNIIRATRGVAADRPSRWAIARAGPAPGRRREKTGFGSRSAAQTSTRSGGTAAGGSNGSRLQRRRHRGGQRGQQKLIPGNSTARRRRRTRRATYCHGIVGKPNGFSRSPLGPAQPNEPGVSFNLSAAATRARGRPNTVRLTGRRIACIGNPVVGLGAEHRQRHRGQQASSRTGRSYGTCVVAPTPLLGIDLTRLTLPRADGRTHDSQGHGPPTTPTNSRTSRAEHRLRGRNRQDGHRRPAPCTPPPAQDVPHRVFATPGHAQPLPAEGQQLQPPHPLIGFVNTHTNVSGDAQFQALR